MPTLRAVPDTEQIVGGTTTVAPMGHAVILAGVAQWDRHVLPGEHQQILVPYLRICPSSRALYRIAPEAGGHGISELLEAIYRTVARGLAFPSELRSLRWTDVAQPGQVDAHFVASWEDADTAWDLGGTVGPFFASDASWLENLGELARAMPLALYLRPVERRLRVEMGMPARATSDDVVETALRALRLHGVRPQSRFGEAPEALGDDLWLSKVRAVEEAMDAAGRNCFRRRAKAGLTAREVRALALLSLEGRLPADWPASPARLQPTLQQLRNAQRRRRQPHGEAHKRLATFWSRPWAVPLLDETIICARTRDDIQWELAKWTRTRTFLRKRWVLGGGRHAVHRPAGPIPTTRLWPGFHHLGGRHLREELRLVGGLRSLLLAFPNKPLSLLTTELSAAAAAQAGRMEGSTARDAWLQVSELLMEDGAALGSGQGPVMVREAD